MDQDMLKRLSHLCVRIENEYYMEDLFTPYLGNVTNKKFGSGNFISDRHIMTNHHVVEDCETLYFSVPVIGKEKFKCKVVCYNFDLDYAILEAIDYRNKVKPLDIGNSSTLSIGSKVIVAGYPLADTNMNLKVVSGNLNGSEDSLLQHDENSNPGSSGSFVLDSKFNIVSLLTAGNISQGSRGNTIYSRPINMIPIKKLLQEIKVRKESSGKAAFPFRIEKPALGICMQKTSQPLINYILGTDSSSKMEKLGIVKGQGVIINDIYPRSQKMLSIKKGDLLLSIDQIRIDSYGDIALPNNPLIRMKFFKALDYYLPDSVINLSYYSISKNKIINEKVKLKAKSQILPGYYDFIDTMPSKGSIYYSTIGNMITIDFHLEHAMILRSKGSQSYRKLMDYASDKSNEGGVLITKIFPGTTIFKNEIFFPYDIITHINDKKINNLKEFELEFKNILDKKGEYIKLTNNLGNHEVLNISDMLKKQKELAKKHKFKYRGINESNYDKDKLKKMTVTTTSHLSSKYKYKTKKN